MHFTICPRGHEIQNFGRPFLSHHYNILDFSDPCLGVAIKKIFRKIHQFYTFYPTVLFPLIRFPYPTDAKYQIWLRLAQ